ncbi:hypothetical protein [Flavobacterium sp. ASW18X]|uniref:hypothetical protein n=1 Tax=Flavobacterium sp. ASW18X TaxID=2572595 RepID=UPI0010AE4A36|nr:hypothetical protein [Flavobacterium sp. ASW18X]TKD65134.1 hypothetical protein FBT53_06290 [Flavobacterium sp. ASW18X]
MQGNFRQDLEKEKQLQRFLDIQYHTHLKQYSFKREKDRQLQLKGVDLWLMHKKKGTTFAIDEKAQLDYINDDLPTFAFELNYLKNNIPKKGWFLDSQKQTDFYALVTAIYQDEPNNYTSCKITMVNKRLLLRALYQLNIDLSTIKRPTTHGMHLIKGLRPKTQGYLYLSKKNKWEQPLNLILRLSYLEKLKVAKRLV